MKSLADVISTIEYDNYIKVFYGKDVWYEMASREIIIKDIELSLQANLVDYDRENKISIIEIPCNAKNIATPKLLPACFHLLSNEIEHNKKFNFKEAYILMAHNIQIQMKEEHYEKILDNKFISPQIFINKFRNNSQNILELFESGYCYYFANLLKEAFERGRIVWAAPYPHICWMDINGDVYDINGLRNDPEIDLYVPIKYLSDIDIANFKHVLAEKINKSDISDPNDLMFKYAKKLCSSYNFIFKEDAMHE